MTRDHPRPPSVPSAGELETIVDAQNVSRHFTVGGEIVQAVRNVSLRVSRGQFVALMGRSGSGKTTLLNLIAGLDHPDQGSIRLAGQEIAHASEQQLLEIRRHTIGFVFQSFGLLPLLSAYENVEIALRIAGVGLQERRDRARELLRTVDLHARSDHRPYELSGGEQQRVAIARALANHPALIVADEPTGELDSGNARAIFHLLHDLVHDSGVTILTATHDRAVLEYADRVEEMADGRILDPHERDLTAGMAPGGIAAATPQSTAPQSAAPQSTAPPREPTTPGVPVPDHAAQPGADHSGASQAPPLSQPLPLSTPPPSTPPPCTLPVEAEPDFRPPDEQRAPWTRPD